MLDNKIVKGSSVNPKFICTCAHILYKWLRLYENSIWMTGFVRSHTCGRMMVYRHLMQIWMHTVQRGKTYRRSKGSRLLLCIHWSSNKVLDSLLIWGWRYKPLDSIILVYMCMCHTCVNVYTLYHVLCAFVISVCGIMLCVRGMTPHVYVYMSVTCIGLCIMYCFWMEAG